ncbi:MAG: cyclase family protein [Novosphingobium sp.]|uniref:cyclase family protein n=1 Tax=Novosphingobium sp. TaxID=1874826 RepID=UPI0030179A9C
MKSIVPLSLVLLGAALALVLKPLIWLHPPVAPGLWPVYDAAFRAAKYVDLTHTITPQIPVWEGFGPPTFSPAVAGRDIPGFVRKGERFTYEKHGFEAIRYALSTDQLGTQLDPPAHWAPEYPAIDELPATYAIRPLVVIDISAQVKTDYGYALQVSDIARFEQRYGRIPSGSVVFVRSDWSKDWPDPALATRKPFPGVSLAALKFLHLERKILFHGHEPLDTDATPTLEGESWLMHHGYAQAEGVANLDKLPPVGALVAIGFPKLGGGTGGYARYIAICPPDWKYGVSSSQIAEAPLPRSDKPLVFDATQGMRVRK